MQFIRNLPIKRKLLLVTLATCGASLTVACTALFWFQSINFQKGFVAELESLGAVVAQNSAAPLAFEDKKSAVEVLSALKVKPHITSAAVFDAQNRFFAGFGAGLQPNEKLLPHSLGQVVFDGGDAHLILPIAVQDLPQGRLQLRARFEDKYRELLSLYILVLVAIVVGSLAVILIVSSTMQRIITGPIATLAEVARNVSEKEDYATRATIVGKDEVGLLTRTFNQMLDQIQSRDHRLRETQQRFEVAVRGSTDGIWDWDLATNAVYLSPRWKSMLGYADHEMPNTLDTFRGVVHPEDAEQVGDKMSAYLAGNDTTFEAEFRVRHPKGHDVWILSRGAALRDDQGKPARFAGSHTDITERKHAEQEVRLAREKFESLVNSIHGIVFEADPVTFQMLFVSDQAEAMLGYPTDLWLKEPKFWETHLHPDDREATLAACRHGIVKGEPFQIEFRMIAAGGHVVWMRESISLSVNRGKPIRLRGVAIDITQQKLAAEQISRMQSELLETSRLAGMAEVATGVLHNVGNVLNSVSVSATVVCDRLRRSDVGDLRLAAGMLNGKNGQLAQFLTSDPKGKLLPAFLSKVSERLVTERDQLVEEMASVGHNIEHIKEIVAMQQTYAKVFGVMEPVPPQSLVEDALRMNTAAFDRHGVRVIRKEDPDAPPVLVDRHKVLQILTNLVRNAKYAMDEQAPAEKRLEIEVGLGAPGYVAITVRDNGVGIAAENLTRIFGHGFTTKKDGHGFGLHSGALAARQMNGNLSVHSEGPGKGATFILEVPVALKTAQPSSAPADDVNEYENCSNRDACEGVLK